MHISWTELRDGSGYWRVMADLNPAVEDPAQTRAFDSALRSAGGETYEEGSKQGDRYFHIPALDRHRGVSHFYLEGYRTGDLKADFDFARSFGETMMDKYPELLQQALEENPETTEDDKAKQLAYHSVYFLQVLTLDRGTTSGLLVHDQNDVGILGSIPSHVDRGLLASWCAKLPAPQDGLLGALVDALPDAHPCPVDDDCRAELAQVVREHYLGHPEALAMQATGNIIPPTVSNHR
jgi:coproporphyrinogen III oxidase